MSLHKYLVVAALLVKTASAQDLNLFEPVEGQADATPAQPVDMALGPVMGGQPAFTLRGASRFGDQYLATLVGRGGEVTKVTWREGERAEVPGFAGFQILGVEAGSVRLQHPGQDACVDSEPTGVSCLGGNVALLKLTNAAPLQSNGTPPMGPEAPFNANAPAAQPATLAEGPAGQQVFINPFTGEPEAVQPLSEAEQQARAERQRARAERLRQFEPVRIDPATVPPGMRLIVTPFGDRIVPERE